MSTEKKTSLPHWRTTFTNGEAEAIAGAIMKGHVSQGPVVAEFERQLAAYLKVPFVVATTSGSTALLMSMMAADLGPGDEVIVPNRTWIATAHAPFLLGAKIKLVDVERDRPIMNAALIEKAITDRTRAIVPVHLCGRSADMRTINAIAKRHQLMVIEDAAQALGSRNSDGLLGTQSDMGCFSLSVAKIISTGQGGFIATRSDALYQKLIAMRTQGVGDIVNAVWTTPGLNFRFTDVLASIGLVQLGLLSARIEKAKAIYQAYVDGLRGIEMVKIIPVDIERGEVPVYVEVLCERRQEMIDYLAEKGVQCRPFYPDLNTAKYFVNAGTYPNSIKYGSEGVYLPAGPEQSMHDIQSVISHIRDYCTVIG